MSEKPESDEFEDEEAEEPVVGEADVDLDQVNKELDLAKRGVRRSANRRGAAWSACSKTSARRSSPATSRTTRSGSTTEDEDRRRVVGGASLNARRIGALPTPPRQVAPQQHRRMLALPCYQPVQDGDVFAAGDPHPFGCENRE